MKTTWVITVSALVFSGLTVAQTVDQLLQQKGGRTPTASSVQSPFAAPVPSWMDQNLKVKTGRYSPTEEARQEDARSSTAFRDATQSVAPISVIDQHYLAKLGRLPGR